MGTRTEHEEHVTVDVEEARYEQPKISDLGTPEQFFLGLEGKRQSRRRHPSRWAPFAGAMINSHP